MTVENYEIVGSYNNQRITSIDAERSVNLFEYLDPLGKKPKNLLSTSGLALPIPNTIFPGATKGFRAQFVAFSGADSFMFVVIGQFIYRIDVNLTVIQINGTLPLVQSVGYVGVDANNGNGAGQVQVIFVDGANGYIYNIATNVFVQITDPAFPPHPIDVTYLDGFFVVAHGQTNLFQLSELNEGLIWGPDNGGILNTFTTSAGSSQIALIPPAVLANYQIGTPITVTGLAAAGIPDGKYYVVAIHHSPTPPTPPDTIEISATAGGTPIIATVAGTGSFTNGGQLQQAAITSHPGNIVACRTLHRRLFLFSQNFTEVWENAGIGTNLPFRRNNGLLMEYGTPAVGSIAVGFDKMFFLSQDRDGQGSVMEVIGTESMPVSNRALDFAIAQYASDPLIGVADARAFLIKENGLIFYRLNFTNANHTYVYGVTMSDIQNPRWHEEEVLNGDRHPAQTHGYFHGVNYVGSYNTVNMYIIDNSFSTNNGEAIRRMRIGRPIMPPTSQRLRVDRWQLDLLQGQLPTPSSVTPPVDLLAETGDMLLTELGDELTTEGGASVYTILPVPQVFLSVSKDGGQTYGYRVQAPMGNIGQRTFRTVWRKLGATKRGQAFVPKIEFFNEIPFIVLGATWVYDVLPE